MARWSEQDSDLPQSLPPIRKLPKASYPSPSVGRQNENHHHRKLTKLTTWITALSNSLWVMPCRAIQDGWVMMETSDKMWSTGEGSGNLLPYSCLENPMNSMKMQKYMTLKYKLPRSVGAQYAPGEKWRNSPQKETRDEAKAKTMPTHGYDGWWK